MTPSYGEIDIKQALRESTAASGVPYHLEDPVAMAALARMFAPLMRTTRSQKAPALTGASNESKKGQNQ